MFRLYRLKDKGEDVMFCNKCGTQFQENDVICNNCGSGKTPAKPIKQPSIAPHAANIAQVKPSQPNQSRGLSALGRFLVLSLVAIVVLVGLSAAGIWCIGETMGFTENCITPLCNNSSTLFDDFCSRCRDAIDNTINFFR